MVDGPGGNRAVLGKQVPSLPCGPLSWVPPLEPCLSCPPHTGSTLGVHLVSFGRRAFPRWPLPPHCRGTPPHTHTEPVSHTHA